MTVPNEIDADVYGLKLPNGGQMVLPDEESLAEREFNATEQRKQGEALAASEDEEAQARGRAMIAAADQVLEWVVAWRKSLEAAMQAAEKRPYVLVMPPWGDVQKAQGEAEDFNPATGLSRTHEGRYMRALLPKCVKGVDPADVLKIDPPAVAEELWRRLMRAVHPDPARLPFLLTMLKKQA